MQLFLLITRKNAYIQNSILIIIKITKKFVTLAESVKNYIDKHFRENIKLEDIVSSLGFYVGHISHQFKKNYSMSIINYMLRRRVIEALVMFENSNVSIQQIFDTLGLDSAQYFSYVFKGFTHITPRQFQTKIRKTHIINPEYIISSISLKSLRIISQTYLFLQKNDIKKRLPLNYSI